MVSRTSPMETGRPIVRVLSGISQVLESDEDSQERIHYVLGHLRQLVCYDCCALLAAGVDEGDTLITVPQAEAREADRLGEVLMNLWHLLSKGVSEQAAAALDSPGGAGCWKSRLVVPLVGFDEVIGVLALGRDTPDAYDEQDLQLLVVVAAKVAAYLTALRARRRELAQEVLARGHAEDEKRRLQVLLAMLSHELRNPLAPIQGAVEVLRMESMDASARREAVGIIDQQVQTLTRLIEDLLDASRVTTRKVQLQRTNVELNTLVQEAAEAARAQFAARKQALSVSLAGSELWVHGDPTRLRQALSNLLSNAVKFTPEHGHAWVRVAGGQGEAVITVRYDGIGIRANLLPHLFELFTQGEQALDSTQRGLGIGLALVKNLVEMHGGTVTAASPGPGLGSEFVVRLPLLSAGEESRPPLEREQPPAQLAREDGTGTAKPAGLRVLIVDDNGVAAVVLSMLLRGLGHDVKIANDGPSGLEAARSFRPDVGILDIGLPGIDGFELARRIRRDEALRDLHLIAMSGYGGEDDKRQAHEAGFDHYIVKPADLEYLQTILKSISSSRAR